MSDTVLIELDQDDFERLGGIAGELEHLPAEIRRHFDQDGRDARYLRILQGKLRAALDQPAQERVEEFRVVYLNAYNRCKTREAALRVAREITESGVPASAQHSFVTEHRTPWTDIKEER